MTNPTPPVIPQPLHSQLRAGSFAVAGPLALFTDADELQSLASFFCQQFESFIEADSADEASVRILLDTSPASDDSYALGVSTGGIDVKVTNGKGLFYALQTLLQLFDAAQAEGSIANWQIEDCPRFDYRGMHLDVSRHFMPLEFLKRFIDLMAEHKLNVFHWHLTDDQGWRIELDSLPRLTELGAERPETVVGHTSNRDAVCDGRPHGGCYSKAEVRELVAYAEQRFITVIPEIDVPGHASAILAAYPECACEGVTEDYALQTRFGIFTDVLCPNPATFSLLSTLLAEVSELFPAPWIHIGGDEVKPQNWLNCEHCQQLMRAQGIDDWTGLQAWFVVQVEAIAAKLGKKIIGWDEVLDGDICSSTAIMSWRGSEGGERAAKLGHPVVMTPVQKVYFDFYQSTSIDEPQAIHGHTSLKTVYDFEPVPDSLNENERRNILGAQGNIWTEYMPTPADVERMALPRMTALAERLWSAEDCRDWVDFNHRLSPFVERLQRRQWQVSGARHHVSTQVERAENVLILTLYTESDQCDIYYSLDGSRPDVTGLRYRQPLTVEQRTTVTAVAIDPLSGQSYGCERLTLVPHLGLGAKISFSHKPDVSRSTEGGALLLNGQLASDRVFQFHEWAGFDQRGMEAVIEFDVPTAVSSIELGFEAGLHRSLYYPTALRAEAWQDGGWRLLATASSDEIAAAAPRLCLPFPTQNTSRLRITAENDSRAYSFEDKKIISMPVYFDELIIE